MANFRWDGRNCPTIEAFIAYLDSLDKPAWATGVTLHHTAIPTLAQWRGAETMRGIRDYYRDVQNWDSGPHLFIAPDGYYIGTPPNQRGIHAGDCNASHIGVEVVGNYNKAFYPPAMAARVYAGVGALLHWIDRHSSALNGHRDCMPGTDCPGLAVDVAMVQRQIEALSDNDLAVIGVPPSAAYGKFSASLRRNGDPLTPEDARHVFAFGERLEVDPVFFAAVWVRESGRPLGYSQLQSLSCCPINIKAAPGEWRPTAEYNGSRWLAFESLHLGALASLLHIKNVFGWQYAAHTVGQIIPIFAPQSDGNDVNAYIKSVIEDMAYIRNH